MPPLWHNWNNQGNSSANARHGFGWQNQPRPQNGRAPYPQNGNWHAARQNHIAQLIGQHGGQTSGMTPGMAPMQGMGPTQPMPQAMAPAVPAMPQGMGMGGMQGAAPMPPGGAPSDGQPMRFDQPLPDGVQMFPATAENMQQLYTIGTGAASPPALPSAPPPTPTPDSIPAPGLDAQTHPTALPTPAPMPPQSVAGKLRELMQSEQNGAMFYRHLSDRAPRDAYGKMLMQISLGCADRQKAFDMLRKKWESDDFTPQEHAVSQPVDFYKGIRFAILEEGRLLRDLSDLLDNVDDFAMVKKLYGQITRKISDIQFLHVMMSV